MLVCVSLPFFLYSKKYRSKAEQPNPFVWQNATAKKSNQAHENPESECQILPKHDLPFVITVEPTSEQSIRDAVEEMSRLDFLREAPLALPMETAL